MNIRRLLFSGMLALSLLVPVLGNSVALLRIGAIHGDARARTHRGWFEVISFDQGSYRWTQKDQVNTPLPRESKVEGPGTLTFTRFARGGTAELYQACANGTFLGSAKLEVPVMTGRGRERLILTMTDVVVTQINLKRQTDERGLPLEQVTLKYLSGQWDSQ